MKEKSGITNDSAGSWFVYILRCSDGSLYTGITNELDRRVRQHNHGTASRYTRSRLPVELAYRELQPSRSAALIREAAIKSLSRREKEVLILTASEQPCRHRPGFIPPDELRVRQVTRREVHRRS